MTYEVVITNAGKSETYKVELIRDKSGMLSCTVNGKNIPVDAATTEAGAVSLLLSGMSYQFRFDQQLGTQQVLLDGRRFDVEVRDPRSLRGRKGSGAAGDGPRKITAPMPGKVVRVLAPEGTQVEAGQGVIVIEAMKMQNELKAPKAGVVKKITAAEGATVNAGDALAVIE